MNYPAGSSKATAEARARQLAEHEAEQQRKAAEAAEEEARAAAWQAEEDARLQAEAAQASEFESTVEEVSND